MLPFVKRLLARHCWFYLALICGAASWIASAGMAMHLRFALTGDTFYLTYLILIAALVIHVPAECFRDWVDDDDEGIVIIIIIALAAVTFSLISIFSLMNGEQRPDGFRLAFSLSSAPLARFVLQTVGSLHYAHAYYAPRTTTVENNSDDGGLRFPDTQESVP
jgi:uncharacterized membrane protein